MAALEFGKENNLIHYSILEFIASKKWEEIEFLQQSGLQSFGSDTITCL
jgi:hypothetical protein